jgi:hypothetical protein
MTDKELEEKFMAMALEHMDEQQIQNIFDLVWDLDHLHDIGKLVSLMKVKR